MHWIYRMILLSMIVACQPREDIAPVIELRTASQWIPAEYRVEPYDTLYSIAFRYDQDYRTLAKLNHLKRPYHLWVGQRLRIKPLYQKRMHPTVSMRSLPRVSKTSHVPSTVRVQPETWQWPLMHAKVTQIFAPSHGQKGINLTTSMSPSFVYAARSGVIAYAGPGFNHEGYLIIMRHGENYLTAYEHHEKNLVKEGQVVRAGEMIAVLSRTQSTRTLHFEMRIAGKPVDPRRYLSKTSYERGGL